MLIDNEFVYGSQKQGHNREVTNLINTNPIEKLKLHSYFGLKVFHMNTFILQVIRLLLDKCRQNCVSVSHIQVIYKSLLF